MEKEKVTEELVRQNGNQAAAVMADYAGQGGGGGSTGGYPYNQPIPLTPTRARTEEDLAKLPQFPNDKWSYDTIVFLLEGGLIPNQIIVQPDGDEGAAVIPFVYYGHSPAWADGPAFWTFAEVVHETSFLFMPSSDGSFMIACYYNAIG